MIVMIAAPFLKMLRDSLMLYFGKALNELYRMQFHFARRNSKFLFYAYLCRVSDLEAMP